MKRLFSILLMNAWSSLSHKASLPTVGMVSISVMALLVASTVTAGASPDAALSGVAKVASAVPKVLVELSSPILGDGGAPNRPKKSLPKPTTDGNSPASGNNSTAAGNNSPNSIASGSQSSSQSVPATLSVSPTITCQQGQSTSTTTYTVNTAELDLQTPASASGTVTWYWETRDDSTTGQQPTDTAMYSQAFNAGVTKIILSNTATPAAANSSSSQQLYTISSDPSVAQSFQLHIISPVNVTSSWISVPVSAASCPTNTSTTNN